MKKKRQRVCRVAALAISCIIALPVYAAPTAVSEGTYDAETLERLLDNKIEYEELERLIHEYNPTILNGWTTIENIKQENIDIRNSMKRLQPDLEDKLKEAKKTGNAEIIAIYQGQLAGYNRALKQYQKGIDKLEEFNTNKSLYLAEKTFTMHAQSAMIGYHTIQSNLQTVQKMRDLYQSQYNLKSQMAAQGMATQTEVLAAQSELLEAERSLASLQDSLNSTGRTLGMMLGWTAEETPEVAPLPAVDYSRIEAMDPQQDLQKAIWNNQSLIEIRSQKNNGSTTSRESKQRSEEEGEAKLAIELQRLYDDIGNKKQAYEAASTGYEAAKISKATTETQYQLGMLGNAEYLGSQLSYIQKEAVYEAANMDLLQAIENYEWGVFGFANIEE